MSFAQMCRLVWPWAIVAVAVLGCSRNVPPQRPAAALYRDIDRLVGFAQTTGWEIDRVELREIETDALLSTCAAKPNARKLAARWIDRRIAALGGPVDNAYQQRGRRLQRVAELLRLSRVRMVLSQAIEQADRDCPFWLEPDPHFAGRQISDDRWQLTLGGGGKGIAVVQGDRSDLRFGGAGRLLIGRTIRDRFGIYVGGELGASASFPKREDGARGNVVFGLDVVIPVVLRYTLVASYFEFEAGPLASVNEQDEVFIPGMHIGAAIGGRATKKKWFFPGAALGVSYERTFPTAAQGDAVTSIKLGLRVAIDIDL